MSKNNLRIKVAGMNAADLWIDSEGGINLRYIEGYDGPNISVSMPISDVTYHRSKTIPWLCGLLPESTEAVRNMYMVSKISNMSTPPGPKGIRNTFNEALLLFNAYNGSHTPRGIMKLLSQVGEELPGAVTIVDPDNPKEIEPITVALSEEDIEQKLLFATKDGGDNWTSFGERWSLSGSQGKFTLQRGLDGEWYECHGSASTTHILKPGISHMRLQALCEHASMRTLTYAGVPCAETEYRLFGDTPALIIKRYDRQRTNQSIYSLHQEDFCQALGFMPGKKYAADGGPTTTQCFQLVREHCLNHDTIKLLDELFAQYLIGSTDCHAKNFSLMHIDKDTIRLSPTYDAASALPYNKPANMYGKRTPWRFAMGIGGENKVGMVRGSNIRRFARNVGIDEEFALDEMAALASSISSSVEMAFEELVGIPGADELQERMVPAVQGLCRDTVSFLDKDARQVPVNNAWKYARNGSGIDMEGPDVSDDHDER